MTRYFQVSRDAITIYAQRAQSHGRSYSPTRNTTCVQIMLRRLQAHLLHTTMQI